MIVARNEVSQNYFVMIVEQQIDRADDEKSNFPKFKKNDPVRPDLAVEHGRFLF